MQKIIWQPSYSVGVKLIDVQHKKLFSILNNLQDGLSDDPALLEQTIYDLKAYVEFHFGEEEKYFKKFGYAEAPSHIEQHHIYSKKIVELHDRFLRQESEIGTQLLDFMNDWILNHVLVIDKKYTKCFNDNGLA